jgi:phosphoadenosine phosphosulfate reductase
MQDNLALNDFVESCAGQEGRELIASAHRMFGKRVAVLSSFGAESAVLLHMVSEVAPDMVVVFMDTEKLFPETLAYRDQLMRELELTDLRILTPDTNDLVATDPDGTLHKKDTDLCCHIRKTAPMEKAMRDFDVIVSGRKRFHGAARSNLDFVSFQDGRLKIEPLAGYTALDLHSYMQKHHLPSHPLRLRGYRSIGCMPCTTTGGTDDDPRAGRWSGSDKTECGIHFSANGKVIRTETRGSVSA